MNKYADIWNFAPILFLHFINYWVSILISIFVLHLNCRANFFKHDIILFFSCIWIFAAVIFLQFVNIFIEIEHFNFYIFLYLNFRAKMCTTYFSNLSLDGILDFSKIVKWSNNLTKSNDFSEKFKKGSINGMWYR